MISILNLQIVLSKYHFHKRKPEIVQEIPYSKSPAANTRDDPGAVCHIRHQASYKRPLRMFQKNLAAN